MKRVSCGSVLVLVLFLVTIVSIWAAMVLRETVHLIEMADAKQTYEQQFRLTESLLEYGIAATKVCYKRWAKDLSKQYTCYFKPWPSLEKQPANLRPFSGNLTITLNKENIAIHAQLLKQHKPVFGLHWTLDQHDLKEQQKGKDSTFIMKEWSMDVR